MIGLILDIETTSYPKYITDSEMQPALAPGCNILSVAYMHVNLANMKYLDYGILYFWQKGWYSSPEALAVHGLTDSYMQQFEPQFEENLLKLNALMQNAVIIGKNSKSFDIPYIKAFLQTYAPELNAVRFSFANPYTLVGSTKKQTYVDQLYSIDVQKIMSGKYFKEAPDEPPVQHDCTYYAWCAYKKGIDVKPTKKGKLKEYIDVFDIEGTINGLYQECLKTGITTYHDALYDTVATYVVLLYLVVIAKQNIETEAL